ncbi:hypothetical protein BY457_11016 [Marinilabilia salmonicolor]|jgi:hypothetical protein|uniref:hypothetical protein n=1 Tax=Marinilabilia salmonicolor TaxID=989 RepID=UPI000D07BDBF|nr:hypothetical protein [Marinilabilia salmonicolor]PRY98204.1 hypothetical protein BY457_11016 [Marinilabilia salmonicolor]
MVFIEEKHRYLSSLEEQPKQNALYALVNEEPFQPPQNNVSEIDDIYFFSVQAIKKNSKEGFYSQYEKISRRKVSENSTAPFIHDDFLIFTLIIGVIRFECKKEWLVGVIKNRAKNATTTTFENLLTGNYQSKANIQSLVLVFLFLLDKSKINNDQLIEAYNAISDTHQSFNSDFIRIIHYKAFDIIIQFKLPKDTDKVSRLLEFEIRFKKRIKVFSYFIYNILLLALLFVSYQILHSLPEELKLKINEVAIIIGIAGVGFFGNLIPMFKVKFQELVLRTFGYPKELTE